ncbi:coiled-coil domain-containing protein 126-like isoform X2 [Denticeps clupeoides]|uniref:MGT5A-like N-terminal domain-containing protein n=2 Tax=Denticeps clupeoides TaxID=299321 RepID=A0A8C4FVZ1_9TELE|nr:coiled-coil domain-containing protein 126-like isoform X2 [Denticeps clupeoides]XP_028847414.1 coiled-coil domain-containing protein 126-like isoform X2 [Denticeps clupeoides]XP_028847469.1 coiled-coil domain-containing protein 126-like isoform X2 [Denticeps clupeoides]XP_028847470.1 coiled-coil domain-containing protein 126-like isoform X2 [Denticeps clupeoides]XP_028847471.1 coiled-coil domain-containing protein 126-like isoform X2 [Denticeps clupeoides]
MLCAPWRRNTPQRLSVALLLVGLCWGFMLLHYTLTRPQNQSSTELRRQILELSRRYVKALNEENHDPSGPQGTSMAGYADLKRTIAVLLDDILNRLGKLEGHVEAVVNASFLNTSHPAGGALMSSPATLQKLIRKDTAVSHPEASNYHKVTMPHPPQRTRRPRPER